MAPAAHGIEKNVEQLFSSSNIAAVREVEARMQQEIEEKKKQLRYVVGDSYRDLISSADTIVDISRSCHRVVEVIGSLHCGLTDVVASVAAHRGAPHKSASTSYDRLYALGSRVRLLVDAPEAIYGSLDALDWLGAARRFARCADVHKELAAHPKQLARRFPLLHHQWPVVRKLRSQIRERAVSWLGGQGTVSAEQAADVLAAVALLQPTDGADLLKTFLAARQAHFTQCLNNLVGSGDADPASLAAVLSDLAGHICSTVAQCGELFLPLPGVASTPLLLHVLQQQQQDAGSGGEVLLEPGESGMAVWVVHLVAAEARLADLSPGGVALECSQWLESVARQLRRLGGSLLGACAGGTDLLAVERAVLAGLEAWRCVPWGQREGGASPMAWPDICLWVLAQPCGLWQLLLEEPLLERARQLLTAGFDAAVDEAAALVDAALAETAALGLAAPSAHPLEPAEPQPDELARKGSKQRLLEGGLVAGAGAAVSGASTWLIRADGAVAALDQRLEAALATALDVCGPQAASAGSGSRARALQSFAQERCAGVAKRVAALLRERFEALQRRAGDDAAPAVHQALLLGRAALSVASRSQQLPRILGPPELWAAAQPASASDPRGASPAPQLGSVQRQCRELAEAAYRLWAAWAAAGLGARLAEAWAADVALAADSALRAWEETVVPGSGGDAADGDTRFALPAAPSPAAAAAALGACQEADRAGGHAIDGPALQQLGRELAGAVAAAAREAATARRLSERGVLQLLFDLRLLLELLGGEAGVSSETQGLEATLAGRLDPIDWATYEPFLYANQRRALSRCHVLFGLLGDAGGGAEAAAHGAGAGSDSGVLAMAAAGPRLAYLPINTPAGVQRQMSGAVGPGASEAAAAGASMLLLSGDGDGRWCSFAALGRSRGPSNEQQREDEGTAFVGGGVGAAAMEALGRARAAMGESFAAGLRPQGLLSSLTSFGGQTGRQ